MRLLFSLLMSCFLLGCSVNPPSDITPVKNFELPRYLGTWYEIARIDNRFEKGLSQVSADYSLRDDGGVKVVNRGWNDREQQWEQSIGKAYFVQSPQDGALKVSFFGPFYGGYNIIKIDEDYQTSLVVGGNKNHLWILSLTPKISQKTLEEYIAFAEMNGFDKDRIMLFK
ncbi:MAG: lipocalin family protein [Providencia heimbachae]|nr:lipocalin family protein [Providencia heimbachae]